MSIDPKMADLATSEPGVYQALLVLHEHFSGLDEDNISSIQGPYTELVASVSWRKRVQLYRTILDQVRDHRWGQNVLLTFIYYEPHHRLVARAVKDYLEISFLMSLDPLQVVSKLMRVVSKKIAVNSGAVLAGVVQIGDRRFNGIARIARRTLDKSEIRDFSRTHFSSICAPAVEFCIDWMAELMHADDDASYNYVATSMMLVVFHDQTGVVRDYAGESGAYMTPGVEIQPVYQNFEDYFREVSPVFEGIRASDGDSPMVNKLINMWKDHCEDAHELRQGQFALESDLALESY